MTSAANFINDKRNSVWWNSEVVETIETSIDYIKLHEARIARYMRIQIGMLANLVRIFIIPKFQRSTFKNVIFLKQTSVFSKVYGLLSRNRRTLEVGHG